MDLGISSPQIDEAERGFSFNLDSNLDMRMNQSQKLTASEIINNFDSDELVKILYDYGEEKFAKKIVREIVKYREEKGRISRTTELADIVKKGIPKFDSKKNPATKTFQALRIKVNEELLEIEQVLPAAFEALEKNGRLAVISFHSLEDRIIKNFIKDKLNTDTVPKKIPIFQKQIKSTPIKVIQKLQTPTEGEVLKNNRSRSSKLRVIEKISEEG
jgi:16S rRNA (cytosine1402-N4)-methyltransferase